MNILLTLAFNGGNYHGFQVQKNAVSVCSTLQNAMQALFGHRPDIKGCSRTDAGVHALEYCVSFHCNTNIPLEKLPLALNYHLPEDIRVYNAQQVAEDFHARYSALGKEYLYVIHNSPIDNPFTQGQYAKVATCLDETVMHDAAQAFVGKHNFASYMSAGGSVTDTFRTISACGVHRQGHQVQMRVAADGFLYNMVRIMAGTLMEVGLGKKTKQDIQAALQTPNRSLAGQTMPPQGLFLAKVFYPQQQSTRL